MSWDGYDDAFECMNDILEKKQTANTLKNLLKKHSIDENSVDYLIEMISDNDEIDNSYSNFLTREINKIVNKSRYGNMDISEKKMLASELLKVAKDLVAYNMGTVKVESVKYGEICFACELKFDRDTAPSEVINALNIVQHQKFDVIQMKLDHGGLLDYDTGWTRVEIKNNAIIVRMYYSGQFEIEEAKAALKEIGVR